MDLCTNTVVCVDPLSNVCYNVSLFLCLSVCFPLSPASLSFWPLSFSFLQTYPPSLSPLSQIYDCIPSPGLHPSSCLYPYLVLPNVLSANTNKLPVAQEKQVPLQ